jgi:Cytochrome c3
MALRRFLLGLIVALCCQAIGTASNAASIFEKLVMPGELSRAHAALEGDCKNCHKAFAKQAQDDLCLSCHKPIAANIAAKTGFHGKRKEVTASGCKHCHTEHIGRGGDIMRLDAETFDHSFTDFALTGAHRKAACVGCHAAGKTHRGAPKDCNGCHAKDDVHKGTMGTSCVACHTTASWMQVSFNHTTDTKYPLTGAHAKVACSDCHKGVPKLVKTSTECSDCHGGAKDPHKGTLGSACQTCHGTGSWKKVLFDHDQTAFPLIGQHAKVVCSSCHKTPDYKATSAACSACHEDKHHEGRLGSDCARCHNAVDWKKVRFDHGRDTGFQLTGKHQTADCAACHKERAPATLKLPTACFDCHQDVDVHRGAYGGDCAKCHRSTTWTQAYIKG